MVDTVSATSIGGRDLTVSRVVQTTPVASVTTPVTATPDPQVAATSVARALSESPPVDSAHVAEVKKAIANGTFPILPATIADRLLALKLEWS